MYQLSNADLDRITRLLGGAGDHVRRKHKGTEQATPGGPDDTETKQENANQWER